MSFETRKIFLTFSVETNVQDMQGLKEALGNYCERFGDLSLIDIREEVRPKLEQISMEKKEVKSW